jgi:hypothetical protein
MRYPSLHDIKEAISKAEFVNPPSAYRTLRFSLLINFSGDCMQDAIAMKQALFDILERQETGTFLTPEELKELKKCQTQLTQLRQIIKGDASE